MPIFRDDDDDDKQHKDDPEAAQHSAEVSAQAAAAIPPQMVFPYFVGLSDKGNFAFYPSGAIRRLGNTELGYLRDEKGVRALGMSGTDQDFAAKVSKELFNL